MNPDRMDRQLTAVWLATTALMGGLLAVDLLASDWASALAIGIYTATWAVYPFTRKTWIKVGRGRGRDAVLGALLEAQRRGLDFEAALQLERERDLAELLASSTRRRYRK